MAAARRLQQLFMVLETSATETQLAKLQKLLGTLKMNHERLTAILAIQGNKKEINTLLCEMMVRQRIHSFAVQLARFFSWIKDADAKSVKKFVAAVAKTAPSKLMLKKMVKGLDARSDEEGDVYCDAYLADYDAYLHKIEDKLQVIIRPFMH